MEKKVGNLFDMFHSMLDAKLLLLYLLFFSSCVFGSSSITLRMLDMNHEPIDQVVCKMPFILQIELQNIEKYTDRSIFQHLQGAENFKTSRSMTKSQRTVIQNGKQIKQVVHDFFVRADKKGTFVSSLNLIGITNQTIRSNNLQIKVVDELILPDEQDGPKYFLKIFFDKKQAYLGERIKLHIKFYDRVFVDDLHLKFPESNDFTLLKGHNNIKTSTVNLQEQKYALTEWVFDLYANQIGSLVLQDIMAVFFAQKLEDRFTFKGGLDFFRSWHKTEKFLRADPIGIEILPLPEDTKNQNVHAVGKFDKFVISVQQNSAQVGQGIILTSELFGDANFEIMDKIDLHLPENFNYYDSNMTIIDENKQHKKSEFIVQASKEGVYHIQPQTLIYFDPVQARYKKLESNSLDITILPSLQEHHLFENHDEQNDELAASHVKNLSDFHLIKRLAKHQKNQLMIPFDLFYRLLLLLCLFWVLGCLYRYSLYAFIIQNKHFVKFLIFWRAYSMCKQARLKNDYSLLQNLFLTLFSQLLKKNIGQLSDADMIAYVTDKGFSVEQVASWKKFYHTVLQASFASDKQLKKENLFDQTCIWINLLKGKA